MAVKVDVRFSDNVAELKDRIAAGTGAIDVMKASVDRTAASIGGQGLFIQANKLTAAIDQLGGVTKLTSAEIDRHSATIDKALEKYKAMGMTAPPAMAELSESLKKAGESAQGAGERMKGFFDGMVAHIAEGILIRDAVHEALGAMKEMILALPEMAVEGSHIASVQHGFELLAGSTKNADDIMQAMRAGVRGTVPDFALMQDATKLLSAGVDVNAKDFGTLTEASVVLAHRGFGDTIDILDKLSQAMITGKTKTAQKMLGIIDAKGAELDYQTALDTGVDKLTAVGKAEAVRQALLEKLEDVVKSAGEQHLTFADRVAQGKTAVTNFTDSLSVAIATSPVLMTAMDTMATAFTGAFGKNQAQTVETLIGWINQAAIAVVQMAETGVTSGGFLVKEYYAVYKIIGDVIQVAEIGALGIEKMSLRVAQFGAATSSGDAAKRYAADVARIQGNIESLTVAIVKRGAALEEADRQQTGVDAKTAGYNKTLEDLRAKMQAASDAGVKHTDVLNALGKTHQDVTRHSEKLTAAQIAWQKVVEDVESAGANLETTLATMDGTVVEGVKHYLAAGVAQGTLASYYGLTAVQVKAVETAVKNETEASKIMAEIHKTTYTLAEEHEKNWRAEVEKTAQAINASVAATLATYRTFYEKNEELTLSGTALQVEQIDVAYRAEIARLGERTTQNATFWDQAKAQIDDFYAHQTDAVYVDNQALKANQTATLQETADKHWATYQQMAGDVDTYSAATIEKFKAIAKAAQDAADGNQHAWISSFVKIGEALPNLVQQAFTGSGGVAGAAKAGGSLVGSELGKGLVKHMTEEAPAFMASSLGKMFGSAIPVVGALAGPLLEKIVGLFGVSAAELAGRKVEATFEQSFGGFQQMLTAVGTAYAATGRGAAAAQADVTALINAEKQGGPAVQAAIDKINLAFADEKKRAADVSTAVDGIVSAAQAAGGSIPPSLQPVLQKLIDMGGLTDDEKAKLEGLATAGTPSFADLQQAAGRYGLTLDDVGGKVTQLSITHEADQIAQDYKALVTDAGGDSDKVLAGMKDSLNKLVDHAMDTGSVLPTALKPLVDQLFKTGQLTDTAGDKITDLSKLKFDDAGDPLAKGLSTLTLALDHLSNILSNLPGVAASAASGIGGALANVHTPTIDIHYAYVADNSPPDVSMAATGGLITSSGVQHLAGGGTILPFPGRPSGIDTVPIWGAAGEGIVSRRGMAAIGTAGLSAINRGGTGSGGGGEPPIVNNFYIAADINSPAARERFRKAVDESTMLALRRQKRLNVA